MPSVETVPIGFTLKPPVRGAEIAETETAHDFFAPELARIFARQVAILGRIIPNFVCASTKQSPPGELGVAQTVAPAIVPGRTEVSRFAGGGRNVTGQVLRFAPGGQGRSR